MKVLIVHPHMSLYGGAELVIVKFANYLTKHGIKNALLTLSISKEIKKELKGTRLIVLRGESKKRKGILRFINFCIDVILLLIYVNKNRKKYDITNVHNFPAEYALFPFVKNSVWMCNEPPIQLYLRSPSSVLLKFVVWVIKIFDKFFVRNYIRYNCVADEFNAKRFEKIYGIKPQIINYGIDYDFFSKGNEEKGRKMFNLQNNFVLIQVGTLTPLKNQMESIKVVERLKEKIPNIKLLLVGESSDRNYQNMLLRYVKETKLDKYVIFTGNLSREVIRDLYKTCDVALFPTKSQGSWLSPFEILCSGKPIVVSSLITSSDIIKRNKIGVVTNEFDKAVMNVYDKMEKYLLMGENGRKWVKDNLSWDKFAERMLALFEIVSSRRV